MIIFVFEFLYNLVIIGYISKDILFYKKDIVNVFGEMGMMFIDVLYVLNIYRG